MCCCINWMSLNAPQIETQPASARTVNQPISQSQHINYPDWKLVCCLRSRPTRRSVTMHHSVAGFGSLHRFLQRTSVQPAEGETREEHKLCQDEMRRHNFRKLLRTVVNSSQRSLRGHLQIHHSNLHKDKCYYPSYKHDYAFTSWTSSFIF